jgi:hypothetical protein
VDWAVEIAEFRGSALLHEVTKRWNLLEFCAALPVTLPPMAVYLALCARGRSFLPSEPHSGKEGCRMAYVTFPDLFQYTLVLIGLAGLFIAAWHIKKK